MLKLKLLTDPDKELDAHMLELFKRAPADIQRQFKAELAWLLLSRAKQEANLQLLSICYEYLGRRRKLRWQVKRSSGRVVVRLRFRS